MTSPELETPPIDPREQRALRMGLSIKRILNLLVIIAIAVTAVVIVAFSCGTGGCLSSTSPPAERITPIDAPIALLPDDSCEVVKIALDPVLPPSTRALLNVTGTCQKTSRDWLCRSNGVMALSVERIRQRFTMALLHCELDGKSWPSSDLWLSDLHECDWLNITGVDPCNRMGEYQILRDFGWPLSGTLPPEISLLSTLWEISLPGNMLSGTIPSDFSKLSQLDTVSLSSNQFKGTIPNFMWEFEGLTSLELANNSFTGTIPSNVHLTEPNLHVLLVGNNDLSGSIPSTFGSLNWRRLHLNNNTFTGTVPVDINSADLQELLLHSNQLTGTFPALSFIQDAGTSKLQEVTLYNNDMIDTSGEMDKTCNLFVTGTLQVLEVDLEKMPCMCCSGAP